MTAHVYKIGQREWREKHRDLLDRVRMSAINQVELTNNGRPDGRVVNAAWAEKLTEVGDDRFQGRDGELRDLIQAPLYGGPVVLGLTENDARLVLALLERFAHIYDHELNGRLVEMARQRFAKEIAAELATVDDAAAEGER